MEKRRKDKVISIGAISWPAVVLECTTASVRPVIASTAATPRRNEPNADSKTAKANHIVIIITSIFNVVSIISFFINFVKCYLKSYYFLK